jgi:hypothetical protein
VRRQFDAELTCAQKRRLLLGPLTSCVIEFIGGSM